VTRMHFVKKRKKKEGSLLTLSRYQEHEKKIWRREREKGKTITLLLSLTLKLSLAFFYMHVKWLVCTHCIYDGKTLMKRQYHNSRRNSSYNSSYLSSIFLEALLFSLIKENESKEQYQCCHSHIMLQFSFLLSILAYKWTVLLFVVIDVCILEKTKA